MRPRAGAHALHKPDVFLPDICLPERSWQTTFIGFSRGKLDLHLPSVDIQGGQRQTASPRGNPELGRFATGSGSQHLPTKAVGGCLAIAATGSWLQQSLAK